MEIEIYIKDQSDFDRAIQESINKAQESGGDIDLVTFKSFEACFVNYGEILYCYRFDVTYKI